MIKAVIFDCFGVLVGQGFDRTYEAAGGDPDKDRDFINEKLGQINRGQISNSDFDEAMSSRLGITDNTWHQAIDKVQSADEELLDYIRQLKKKYKTAVLSNANVGVIVELLGAQRTKECFDDLIVSAEVGLIKPDERIYLLAAERLGVSPNQCIYIDDRQRFVDAGNALGMKSILYTNLGSLKKKIESLTNSKD
ncbi:MAG TPA: HAD family phosphatase [Candidatus Sulfotelmatobacter sp.]|nr:HAD family phosphatase [Candidatus Sulfotelmatobacter sp.]